MANKEINDHPHIHDEDIVVFKGKDSVFGIVEKLGWDNSDDEYSTDEDEDEIIPEDKVKVFWTNLAISNVENPDDLDVYDRSFLHGDYVSPLDDPQGPVGIVKNVYVFADVQYVQSNEVLYNVPTPYLSYVTPCIYDYAVVYKNWIGRVEDYTYSLTIQFSNGLKCKILQSSSSQQLESIDINPNRSISFFPGQRVRIKDGKSNIWNNAKFINNNDNSKIDINSLKEGTVIDVDFESVEVTWLAPFGYSSSNNDDNDPFQYPPINISPKELLFLNHFNYCRYEIGEHCYIDPKYKMDYSKKKPIDWNDDVNKDQLRFILNNPNLNVDFYDDLNKIEPNKQQQQQQGQQQQQQQKQQQQQQQQQEHDKKKKKKRFKSRSEKRRIRREKKKKLKQPSNCVQILRTQTYIDIILQDGTVIEKVRAKDYVPRSIMENDFCPGHFVLKIDTESENNSYKTNYGYIKRANYKERTCVVRWVDSDQDEECSVYSIEHHPDLDFSLCDIIARLNFDEEIDGGKGGEGEGEGDNNKEKNKQNIGQIIDINDGKIGIVWLDNTITYEEPLSVVKIDDEINEAYDLDNNRIVELIYDIEDDVIIDEDEEDEWVDALEEDEDEYEYEDEIKDDVDKKIEETSPTITTEEEEEEETTHDTTDGIDKSSSKNFFTFPSVPDSHRYKDKPPSSMTRAFAKRVMSEWNILISSLPKGVWVGAYEDRIDLLTVLIEGSEGTPYYRSIFEFDIYLTPYYPSEAPLVYYRSRVPKFNPNLNEDGSVCLSLLGTWIGKGVEVWNPEQSNLLQLIVSIQGLILGTSEPYYLEAGYDKQRGTQIGAHNSRLYNERALLHSLQLMPKIIKDPTFYFEEHIHNHFREVKDEIIEMINKFLELKNIDDDNNNNNDQYITTKFGVPLKPKPSNGFLLSLEKLYPSIKEAFESLKKK